MHLSFYLFLRRDVPGCGEALYYVHSSVFENGHLLCIFHKLIMLHKKNVIVS